MTTTIRVLIADDSARARSGLRALLATWPEFEVIGEASNGAEALRFVEEQQPMAVLMDLNMPLMDGAQATRLIKRRWPTTYIVLITLNATSKEMALCAGADAFVAKGEAPDRLLAALRVACSTAQR